MYLYGTLPRLDLAGVPQHVLQRGNNSSACFFQPADYLFYLDCLQQAARQHACLVYAYVLMTNQVHLLVSGQQVGCVSAVMQTVGRRYVRPINQSTLRANGNTLGRTLKVAYSGESFLPIRWKVATHSG